MGLVLSDDLTHAVVYLSSKTIDQHVSDYDTGAFVSVLVEDRNVVLINTITVHADMATAPAHTDSFTTSIISGQDEEAISDVTQSSVTDVTQEASTSSSISTSFLSNPFG